MSTYDAATDQRPGHVTRLRSDRSNGAWGACSCGWTSPIGLMGEAAEAIAGHLASIDGGAQ